MLRPAFFRRLHLTSQVGKEKGASAAVPYGNDRFAITGQFTKRTFQHSAFSNDLKGVTTLYFGVGNTITIYTMTCEEACGNG